MPDQNQAPDWKTGITDETMRAHPALQTFKSVDDLVKSHIALQPLVGKEKIPVPGEKDGKEIWDVVFNRLGRPEKPEGYEFPDVKVPDGFPALNPEGMKAFQAKAHELGLTKKQAAELFAWNLNNQVTGFNEGSTKKSEAQKAAETQLRTKWGAAYDQKLKLASMVANKFGSEAFKDLLDSGKGNEPAVVEFLASIGEQMSEATLIGKPGNAMMTPEAAQMEINKMMGDKASPYWNKQHPEHDAMVARMAQLYQFVHPEPKEQQ